MPDDHTKSQNFNANSGVTRASLDEFGKTQFDLEMRNRAQSQAKLDATHAEMKQSLLRAEERRLQKQIEVDLDGPPPPPGVARHVPSAAEITSNAERRVEEGYLARRDDIDAKSEARLETIVAKSQSRQQAQDGQGPEKGGPTQGGPARGAQGHGGGGHSH